MFKTSHQEMDYDREVFVRPGWEDMKVWWLADRENGGTDDAAFIEAELPPNGSHELHRHPTAEEYFYVISGTGLHLTEDGPTQLGPGDLVVTPKNEWHGFVNNGDEPVRCLAVLAGVNHYTEAGYDIAENQPEEITGVKA
jgi:quercetin dioxygenase-like cupin family protein